MKYQIVLIDKISTDLRRGESSYKFRLSRHFGKILKGTMEKLSSRGSGQLLFISGHPNGAFFIL